MYGLQMLKVLCGLVMNLFTVDTIIVNYIIQIPSIQVPNEISSGISCFHFFVLQQYSRGHNTKTKTQGPKLHLSHMYKLTGCAGETIY